MGLDSTPVRRTTMVLAACLTVAAPSRGSAQIVPGVTDLIPGLPRLWLGAGPAAATGGGVERGLGLLGQGALQWRRHQLALRGLWAVEASGSDGVGEGRLFEIGLLYGRTRIRSWTHTTLSGGVAFVRLTRCTDAGEACSTVGIPVAAEAALQALSGGLGLQLFANLNRESSYAGLAVFLQLGWLP